VVVVAGSAGVGVVGAAAAGCVSVEPGDEVVDVETSRRLYFVPSAVFTSLSFLPRWSVNVGEPPAREPPATAIVAVVLVSETSRKSGSAAGKAAFAATFSFTPFTEIVAET